MRLIDADALIKAPVRKEPFSDCARAVIAECMAEVRHAPTIEERKTGKWIELDFTEAWEYKCDQCGRRSDFNDNFCPNCGADMRGSKHETD